MSENKNFSFKDWVKKKTTAEEHAIIEAEHSPADNINEATKISEEKTGNSGKTRNY